jgi:uncharacterized protein YjiS (DUF1127 family)
LEVERRRGSGAAASPAADATTIPTPQSSIPIASIVRPQKVPILVTTPDGGAALVTGASAGAGATDMTSTLTTTRPWASFGRWLAERRRESREKRDRRRIHDETYAQLARMSDRDLGDIGVSRLRIGDVARETAERR